MEVQHKVPAEPTGSWRDARLLVTDEFEAPPVILRVDDSIVGTLGNFSASTGKAKSKKTFNVCAIVAAELKATCWNLSDQSVHYSLHNDLNDYLRSRWPVKEYKRSRGRKL